MAILNFILLITECVFVIFVTLCIYFIIGLIITDYIDDKPDNEAASIEDVMLWPVHMIKLIIKGLVRLWSNIIKGVQ